MRTIGGAQADTPIGNLFQLHPSKRYLIDCEELSADDFSGKQLRGFWWLLGEWIKRSDFKNVTKDDLHDWACLRHFGYFKKEYPDGRVEQQPLRTLTKVWNEDRRRYYGKRATLEEVQELIDWIYATAAEGGVILPDLKPAYKRELGMA